MRHRDRYPGSPLLFVFSGWGPLFKKKKKGTIRGGIRTHDLLLRRETRYPLRYTDQVQPALGFFSFFFVSLHCHRCIPCPTGAAKMRRQRRDLNSRGQSPLAFKTNSLTTRTRCLYAEVSDDSQLVNKKASPSSNQGGEGVKNSAAQGCRVTSSLVSNSSVRVV